MSVVIQVDHLSKQYRLGVLNAKRLRDDVKRWLARLRGKEDPLSKVTSFSNVSRPFSGRRPRSDDAIWALKDVSFEVKQGEVLGVVGQNGAGKSTLLKILSRITAPTSGEVRIKGRIASLLEVGTGFNPELTGRDNVFLNGAILGMTKAEINEKFDEIVAFSEVEQFIDTPVKRYSSGMKVRLAFAVAAHLEPEILIVDEVLAVGDASFQKKCLGKMGDVASHGRTVLFVSHNMVAVQSLCQRALLMSEGRLVDEGSPTAIVTQYLREAFGSNGARQWDDIQTAPGTDALRIHSVQVLAETSEACGLLTMQTPLRVETRFWVLRSDVQLHITYHLLNDQGIVVLTTACPSAHRECGLYTASFVVSANLLNSGGYSLKLLILHGENQVTYQNGDLVSFSVADTAKREQACLKREPGVIQPIFLWNVVQDSTQPAKV